MASRPLVITRYNPLQPGRFLVRPLGTIPGKAASAPAYEYPNVRRLLLSIETALNVSLQWTAFQPNGPQLWAAVELTIGNYLNTVFQSGVLAGNSQNQAYFVRCPAAAQTASQKASGELTALVGVAPQYPAEFVILQIGMTTGS